MSELDSLKEKQDKDTTDRKVGEKALFDNIKASIDPILKSDFKGGEHIGIGACLKGLQEEVTNYCTPTINKKWRGVLFQLTIHSVIGPLVQTKMQDMYISPALQ